MAASGDRLVGGQDGRVLKTLFSVRYLHTFPFVLSIKLLAKIAFMALLTSLLVFVLVLCTATVISQSSSLS